MSKKFVGLQFVETVREGNMTFAFGIYADAKIGRVPFIGVAKKNPTDKENKARGRNLAIGRSLQNLGKEIEKREWKQLQKNRKSTSGGHKLSAAEVKKLKAAGAEVRKERAAKK